MAKTRKLVDLFSRLLPPEKRTKAFDDLCQSPQHADARALIGDLALRMGDSDGKFRTDFQGEGFHARLFELACFAWLEEQDLKIDRSQAQPDFIADLGVGGRVAVEACTAHSSEGQRKDISLAALRPEPTEESWRCTSA